MWHHHSPASDQLPDAAPANQQAAVETCDRSTPAERDEIQAKESSFEQGLIRRRKAAFRRLELWNRVDGKICLKEGEQYHEQGK